MKLVLAVVSSLIGLAAFPAQAEYGHASGIVRCESNDGRTRECPVGPIRGARLVRQLSRGPCVEGQTWGATRRAIWVSHGCRGEFAVDDRRRDDNYGTDGAGPYVRCESNDGRWNRCPANTRGDVELVRQLSRSACIRGQSWGTDGRGIWVNGGCRADFRVESRGWGGGAAAERFRCESDNGGPRFCPVDARGSIRLVRQLSRSPCTEGRTWGRDRGGVWVEQGCRGEFEVARGRGWDN
ncbi:DUF3011 domain-containing protein [Lysobacter humi (ex Lee et al. 2017)]